MLSKKIFLIFLIGLFLSITLHRPTGNFFEAIRHLGYAKAGIIEISMEPIIESDKELNTKEVKEVTAVAEEHHPGFDLSKPYKGQKIGDGVITSPQGWRIHPIHGTKRYHSGPDWAKSAAGGEPLYAPGKIEVKCKYQAGGAGHYAEFKFYGMTWQLLHLQSGSCKPGGHEKGWIIGRVGSTGGSTGPHLHLTLLGPNREYLHVGTGHVAAVVVQEG